MGVCFTARVSNKKQNTDTAVESQDALTVVSDQTQYWLLVPWKGILSVCALVMMFAGEGRPSLTQRANQTKLQMQIFFSSSHFQRNLKRQKSLMEYRDKNDQGWSFSTFWEVFWY